MKTLNAVIAISILVVSSFAMAEGGGDRVYGRMMQENQQAMEQYAIKMVRPYLRLFITSMV